LRNKEWIAMVLAGGRGTRLGVLTEAVAKPAVPFGGQYRIIDFTLSNCKNSGIDTVGILTQYQPLTLHAYIGNGAGWDLDCKGGGGVHMLPPYASATGGEWYTGTADAVYKNREFIEQFEPQYVVVLSGDHIYKMDYSVMLEQHKLRQADVTVGVLEVPWREANRFGIMETTASGRIIDFVEKPYHPKGNQASMGVYIFTWNALKQYLIKDAAQVSSSHDFGKNIIPTMLAAGQRMYAYHFNGYWKDVGTLASYWEANMDLLGDSPKIELDDAAWPVYSPGRSLPPHYHGAMARVSSSLVAGGVTILGEVENSVIFPGAYIGDGVKVKNSVIMPYARMEQNSSVDGAIVIPNTVITARMNGEEDSGIIQVVARSTTQEAVVQVSLAV
jgi:glucose-1-phosphate adenylyltransferase